MDRHILVVEDQVDVAEMFFDFLQSLGYRVSLAHDGQTALAIDADDPADLVITDYSMPIMNGDELSVKLFERRAGLPIVMISGYSFDSAPCAGVRLMAKPVGLFKLADVVSEMLQPATPAGA